MFADNFAHFMFYHPIESVVRNLSFFLTPADTLIASLITLLHILKMTVYMASRQVSLTWQLICYETCPYKSKRGSGHVFYMSTPCHTTESVGAPYQYKVIILGKH